ncbi:MAG: amidase [Nitrospirae bacterium]|nr:amidase [Nitrospirota bacterium]
MNSSGVVNIKLIKTASDIVKEIRSGNLSAADVAMTYLERIRSLEGKISAWEFLNEEHVFEQTAAVDNNLSRGKVCGRLCGVPIGVKDIFNTRGFPVEMGSPIWKGHKAGNDARVVEQMMWDDGIIMGKTVTAEFAVHFPGATRNPHNIKHTPGTSSSGSAAAVASLMVPVALGTQTAGSLIRPASYCGIYAMKPTFGMIPRTGVLKTMETLDQVGFFTRSVRDIKLLFDSARIGGRDHPLKEEKLLKDIGRKFWKVGIVKGSIWNGVSEYAKKDFIDFISRLANENILIEEAGLPEGFENVHAIHSHIYNSDLAYYFKEEYYRQPELMSDVLKHHIKLGFSYPPDNYSSALKEQRTLIHRLDSVFEEYDILLSLSSFGEAPVEEARDKDYCPIWTLCHVPAVNVPVFTGPKGLPFGLQVVAKRYNDLLLINFLDYLDDLELVPPVKVAEGGTGIETV